MRGAIWVALAVGVLLAVVRERRRVRCWLGQHGDLLVLMNGEGRIRRQCRDCLWISPGFEHLIHPSKVAK